MNVGNVVFLNVICTKQSLNCSKKNIFCHRTLIEHVIRPVSKRIAITIFIQLLQFSRDRIDI